MVMNHLPNGMILQVEGGSKVCLTRLTSGSQVVGQRDKGWVGTLHKEAIITKSIFGTSQGDSEKKKHFII